MVDDGYDTAYYLVPAQGDEGLCLTELEGSILLRVKGVAHIGVQLGYCIGRILIEFVIEADESLHLSLCGNGYDSY
jgi:hypothetical protein